MELMEGRIEQGWRWEGKDGAVIDLLEERMGQGES
jgi:hypothetical protein